MGQALLALAGGAGTVITAFIAYLGVRYTQRLVSKASDATARLEQSKVDASAYGRARESYEAAMRTQSEQIGDLSRQVAELRHNAREDHAEMEELRDRIEKLEVARRADRTTIQALSTYIRALVLLLRQAGVPYPPPPVALSETDPGGWGRIPNGG